MSIIERVINKIVKKLRFWWYRMHSTLIPSGNARYLQPILFLGKGKVIMGEGNTFGYYPSPLFYNGYTHIEARHEDAVIEIGSNNYFNNNLIITAEHSCIKIGNDCLIGTNVSIINSDFHPISIANRHRGAEKQIRSNRR